MNTEIEKSIVFVKDFLNNYYPRQTLYEQINKFKNYNFSKLAYEQGLHEDSTNLAKAIYFIIWYDTEHNKYRLPYLTSIENMEKYYGGETINTFNTLFQEELEGAKQFIDESDTEFYKLVNEFKKKYLTIGNFMLLPKGKVNDLTLNTKKGSYSFKYKDYADLFFFDLFETNNLDEFKKSNTEYFKIDKKDFFEKNFLNHYLKNDKVKIIFKHDKYDGKYYPLYWWKYKCPKEYAEYYKSFALDYIQKATKIINYRTNKICEILSKRLMY